MRNVVDEIGEPFVEQLVYIPRERPPAHHHAQLEMLNVGGMNEEEAVDGLGGKSWGENRKVKLKGVSMMDFRFGSGMREEESCRGWERQRGETSNNDNMRAERFANVVSGLEGR